MSDDKPVDHDRPSEPEAAGTAKTMRRREALARLTRTAVIAVPVTLGVMSMKRSAKAY